MRRHLSIESVFALAAFGVCASTSVAASDRTIPSQARVTMPNDAAAKAFEATYTSDDIVIDGALTEAAWETAMRVPLPFETAPGDNAPARVPTTCLVTFGTKALYFGCRADDPRPGDIRAYIGDRDNIDGQDRISLTIDPFNDARRAFEFSVNALGVQGDGTYDQQADATDLSWDAIWQSSGRLAATGYVTEAAIPLSSIRFPSTEGAGTWRFFFLRELPRSERIEVRSMQRDRDNSCLLCQANLMRSIKGLVPPSAVELVPTFAAARNQHAAGEGARLATDPVKADLGLDVRWGLTSDVSLNATVNPDFSQVEADQIQLDANARFALFFPEKRPFFLEGADFFNTLMPVVFTRTIVEPSFGSKITGKAGANAIGLMVARDEINRVIVPGNQDSGSATFDGGVTTVAARYRRDIGGSSTVGVLYAGREGQAYANRIIGADAFLRLAKPLNLRVQLLRSSSNYPVAFAAASAERERLGGTAFQADLRYDTSKYFFLFSARSLDRDFRADAGYVPQVDVSGINLWATRKFQRDAGSWFTKLFFTGGVWRDEDAAGHPTERGSWAQLRYEGPLQTNVWVTGNHFRAVYDGKLLDLGNFWVELSTRPRRISFDLVAVIGTTIDTANSRKADQVRLEPTIAVRAGRHADVRFGYARQELSRSGQEVLTTQAAQVRAVYSFTPRTFLRALVQIRDTARNPNLFRDPVDRRVTAVLSQLLFAYKVNPQTAIYVGLADMRDAITNETFGISPLEPTNRTIFLKLGYAWRP
jgi:hypothetical protein